MYSFVIIIILLAQFAWFGNERHFFHYGVSYPQNPRKEKKKDKDQPKIKFTDPKIFFQMFPNPGLVWLGLGKLGVSGCSAGLNSQRIQLIPKAPIGASFSALGRFNYIKVYSYSCPIK